MPTPVRTVRTMNTPREQLAQKLKQARIDARYQSQSAFARHLHISRPVITRAENPAQPVPTPDVLESYAEATGVPLGELEDLAKRANGGTPAWFMPYKQAESSATTLRCWAPLGVPGLLQTPPYARLVLGVEAETAERLDELVAARLERQRVLERVHLTGVLSARVLTMRIGSAEVMADQLAHLVTVAERPNIALHVVPEEVNTGAWAAIDIASHGTLITVCMSTGLDDVTSTEPGTIDHALRSFERVLGSALPCEESLEYMTHREAEWRAKA